MYKKCWGCNEYKVSLFAWLAGDDMCDRCRNNITDPIIAENWKVNSRESQRKIQERETRQLDQNQKIGKVFSLSKTIVSTIFGVIALLWLVIMLPAQPDFGAIVIGWVIIGGMYLLFKVFAR